MRISLFRFLLLVLPCVAAAQAAKPQADLPERHAATSSLQFKVIEGKENTIIRNERFSVYYHCLDECSNYVLRETVFSDQEEGVENPRELVSAVSWRKDTPGKILWSLKFPGSAGKLLDDFYEVTRYGCCGDWDEKSYFSLRTGKKVFSSSTDEEKALLKIRVANKKITRFITFDYKSDKTGRVQFGDPETILQTLTLTQNEIIRPPSLLLRVSGNPDAKSVDLFPKVGNALIKGVSGVSAVLRFEIGDRDVEVIIPIENDRLLVQKATVPQGFSLK